MNGNITIIARAADLAAKKGMMVVVAAGNDGTDSWHFIGTPADADSVVAVGAVTSSEESLHPSVVMDHRVMDK